jgi:hypothetical protein
MLMKLEHSRQIFEEQLNLKFHENLSNGSRVFPCGRTEGQIDGRTYMTKLIIAFRRLAIAPNKDYHFPFSVIDADEQFNSKGAAE